MLHKSSRLCSASSKPYRSL